MVVTSPDNFARTRAIGFTVQGIKRRHKRAAERIAPGDRVCWYVTGGAGFAATATVRGGCVEERSPIWISDTSPDDYPWRFALEPDTVVDLTSAVAAERLADRFAFVRRWPAPHWRLAFQGHLHELPAGDFALVEDALTRAVPA